MRAGFRTLRCTPARLAQDEVHDAIGYDVVPYTESRIDVRRRLLAGEELGEADRLGTHEALPEESA